MPTIAIYLVVALGVFGAGAVSGWRVESWHATAREQAAVAAGIAQYKAEAVQAQQAAIDLEKQRDEANARSQALSAQVNTIVAKPIYRNVCLDPDGLRAANAALAGSTAASTGAHPNVSAAKPAH